MFCPHSVFLWFVWISEQTSIISLHNIKLLVFITENVFAVQYDPNLTVIYVIFPCWRGKVLP